MLTRGGFFQHAKRKCRSVGQPVRRDVDSSDCVQILTQLFSSGRTARSVDGKIGGGDDVDTAVALAIVLEPRSAAIRSRPDSALEACGHEPSQLSALSERETRR
jgi:hypothetical protein